MVFCMPRNSTFTSDAATKLYISEYPRAKSATKSTFHQEQLLRHGPNSSSMGGLAANTNKFSGHVVEFRAFVEKEVSPASFKAGEDEELSRVVSTELVEAHTDAPKDYRLSLMSLSSISSSNTEVTLVPQNEQRPTRIVRFNAVGRYSNGQSMDEITCSQNSISDCCSSTTGRDLPQACCTSAEEERCEDSEGIAQESNEIEERVDGYVPMEDEQTYDHQMPPITGITSQPQCPEKLSSSMIREYRVPSLDVKKSELFESRLRLLQGHYERLQSEYRVLISHLGKTDASVDAIQADVAKTSSATLRNREHIGSLQSAQQELAEELLYLKETVAECREVLDMGRTSESISPHPNHVRDESDGLAQVARIERFSSIKRDPSLEVFLGGKKERMSFAQYKQISTENIATSQYHQKSR